MRIEDRVLYAEDGKLLDFKEPKYVVNQHGEMEHVHLFTPRMKMGRMDSADNYIELTVQEVAEIEEQERKEAEEQRKAQEETPAEAGPTEV